MTCSKPKILVKATAFLASFFSLCSCVEQTPFGFDFQEDPLIINAKYIEVKPETHVLRLDSVFTTNPTRMLFGKVDDPIMGRVKATAYAQVVMPLGKVTLNNGTNPCDSIILFVKHRKRHLGDPGSSPQKIGVYELLSSIDKKTESYYNFTSDWTAANGKVSETAMGQIDYLYKPAVTNDTIKIKLDNAFGNKILTLPADAYTSNDAFREHIKGLMIAADTVENSMIFDVNPYDRNDVFIRLYYQRADGTGSEFTLFGLGDFFHHLRTDYSTGTVASLQELTQMGVNSSELDNKCYIQAGMGIGTKISLSKETLLAALPDGLDPSRIVINRATLTFSTDPDTYSQYFPSPSVLLGVFTDQFNKYKKDAADDFEFVPMESGSLAFLKVANAQKQAYIANARTYTDLNITTLVSDVLRSGDRQDLLIDGFLLEPSPNNASLARTVIFDGNPSNPYPMKIKIYYTPY